MALWCAINIFYFQRARSLKKLRKTEKKLILTIFHEFEREHLEN